MTNNQNPIGGFDLSNVLGAAQQAVEELASAPQGNNTKLIYPSDGELRVRLLLSTKASGGKGVVTRLINRHTVGDTKVPCMNDYNLDCEVCRVVSQIENFSNADLWKYKSTTRGLAYAQYVSSNYKGRWDKDNPEPEKGELVLLMFPWVVYGKINEALVASATAPHDLLINPNGIVVEISRYLENGNVRYNVSTDGSTYKSAEDPESFNEIIESVPNLDDAIQDSKSPTERQLRASNNAATNLSIKFGLLSPSATGNHGNAQSASQNFNQQVNQQPQQNFNQQQQPQQNFNQHPAQGQQNFNQHPAQGQQNFNQHPAQGQQNFNQQPQQDFNQQNPNQQQVNQQPGQPGMVGGDTPPCFGHYDKTARKCIVECDYDIQCAMMSSANA